MFVYFVRHGQSLHNAKRLHQGREGGLSDLGKQQAGDVAEKLKLFPIETIIASPFERTVETAEIINQTLQKPIVYSELVRELTQPSEIHNLTNDNPLAVHVKALRHTNSHDPNWHYSDEENFHDYSQRIKEFLIYLDQETHGHILVVSHAAFIRALVATILHGEELTPQNLRKLYHFFYTTNTGITILEKEHDAWLLKTWNDYAHVKELEKEVIW